MDPANLFDARPSSNNAIFILLEASTFILSVVGVILLLQTFQLLENQYGIISFVIEAKFAAIKLISRCYAKNTYYINCVIIFLNMCGGMLILACALISGDAIQSPSFRFYYIHL